MIVAIEFGPSAWCPHRSAWLDVRVVEDGGADEATELEAALAGASTVVLCSAAHAGFEADADAVAAAAAVVPGSLSRAKAEAAFSPSARGVNVRVPRAEAEAAGRRLLAEISAVGAASQKGDLRHVVLRSSMGVRALEAVRGATAVAGPRRIRGADLSSSGGRRGQDVDDSVEPESRPRRRDVDIPRGTSRGDAPRPRRGYFFVETNRGDAAAATQDQPRRSKQVADADVLALARMGGEEAVRAIANAEEALATAAGDRVGTTVIRLGALTDDAGGVPLAFSSGAARDGPRRAAAAT